MQTFNEAQVREAHMDQPRCQPPVLAAKRA